MLRSLKKKSDTLEILLGDFYDLDQKYYPSKTSAEVGLWEVSGTLTSGMRQPTDSQLNVELGSRAWLGEEGHWKWGLQGVSHLSLFFPGSS